MKAVAAREKDIEDLTHVLPKCWKQVDEGRVFRKLRVTGAERSFTKLLARLNLDQSV